MSVSGIWAGICFLWNCTSECLVSLKSEVEVRSIDTLLSVMVSTEIERPSIVVVELLSEVSELSESVIDVIKLINCVDKVEVGNPELVSSKWDASDAEVVEPAGSVDEITVPLPETSSEDCANTEAEMSKSDLKGPILAKLSSFIPGVCRCHNG